MALMRASAPFAFFGRESFPSSAAAAASLSAANLDPAPVSPPAPPAFCAASSAAATFRKASTRRSFLAYPCARTLASARRAFGACSATLALPTAALLRRNAARSAASSPCTCSARPLLLLARLSSACVSTGPTSSGPSHGKRSVAVVKNCRLRCDFFEPSMSPSASAYVATTSSFPPLAKRTRLRWRHEAVAADTMSFSFERAADVTAVARCSRIVWSGTGSPLGYSGLSRPLQSGPRTTPERRSTSERCAAGSCAARPSARRRGTAASGRSGLSGCSLKNTSRSESALNRNCCSACSFCLRSF
mmetsp:Transcript_31282/g.102036  ORF Transcript_31282/g.102036 Transcript_31282/m.102036 type:complete len:304 (-) Transcript_31282:2059-2970(-)